jgi:hypothetical protein
MSDSAMGEPPVCAHCTAFAHFVVLVDTFSKENETIREIQTHMETYFQQRDTRIARDGLTALTNTLAGIYYIPFKVIRSLSYRAIRF